MAGDFIEKVEKICLLIKEVIDLLNCLAEIEKKLANINLNQTLIMQRDGIRKASRFKERASEARKSNPPVSLNMKSSFDKPSIANLIINEENIMLKKTTKDFLNISIPKSPKSPEKEKEDKLKNLKINITESLINISDHEEKKGTIQSKSSKNSLIKDETKFFNEEEDSNKKANIERQRLRNNEYKSHNSMRHIVIPASPKFRRSNKIPTFTLTNAKARRSILVTSFSQISFDRENKQNIKKKFFENSNLKLALMNCGCEGLTLSDGGSPELFSKDRKKFRKIFSKVDEEDDFEDEDLNFSDTNLIVVDNSKIMESKRFLEEGYNIGYDSFNFMKLISKGNYGRVWLVQRKVTGDIYAMKIVNFVEKMSKNNLDLLRKENQIFTMISGDFVVKALFTFTYETYICFVMEYMYGGDLGSYLEKNTYFEEKDAKFYIAEIILAVEHLHSQNIIHRDLKPDNILVDADGHIKLTDFGLSDIGLIYKQKKQEKVIGDDKTLKKYKTFKNVIDKKKEAEEARLFKRSSSYGKSQKICSERLEKNDPNPKSSGSGTKKINIVGTPDYMAPEVLDGVGLQNPVIDWWSVGVMLFEFLLGIPPFNDDTKELVFKNIKEHYIPWDKVEEGMISNEAKDLINKLLIENPKLRLGAKGAKQIKEHEFFTGLNNFRILFFWSI